MPYRHMHGPVQNATFFSFHVGRRGDVERPKEEGGEDMGDRPAGVDHLIYGTPDLERGLDEVERRLGLRPAGGGRHPQYGTRNALLALGPETYLEVMAPDPELPAPDRGRLFRLDQLERPRLVTWSLRREEIDEAARRAAAEDVELGPVQAGSREQPDGTSLAWRLTDPRAMPAGGVVPFLIAWGATPHPARSAPGGGSLAGLRAEHPEPAAAREALAALGVEMRVEEGDRPRLVAAIRTEKGRVELL